MFFIYAAVLTKDCTPCYFSDETKALNYIFNNLPADRFLVDKQSNGNIDVSNEDEELIGYITKEEVR